MAPYDRSMADDDKVIDRVDEKLLVLPLGEESKLITQTIANDTARQILELLAEGAMSTSAIAKKLDIPLTTAQYNVEKLIEAKLVVVEKTKYSEKGREVKLYAPAKRMIVLVPANTPRQAVMDVLRKYLVLVPVAGFIALMVELAMTFLNGNLSDTLATRGSDQAPLMSTAGNNLSADAYPPAPAAWSNVTDTALKSTGEVSGHMATANTTIGLNANGSGFMENYSGVGAYTPEVNRSMVAGPDVTNAVPQTIGDSGTAHGLIPPDLLNHWGLWFFIGCLAIIGVMIVIEVYRGRKKK